ncbi:hypothetical protein [Yersinia ruckeri]|uniref:hypothetical protein n=1 Tax=Yersinia ruckeri TaxID=29486 RepID=UPI002237C5D2|nr:hypothetical protein [Yersinia ruckeri]MCW6598720.1 hypothetical protein [Yersinia ruckeri]
MDSLGGKTERDFQSTVIAGYKTLAYEGFTLKEPLIVSDDTPTNLQEGLYLLQIVTTDDGIVGHLFLEGMFKPLSGGSVVKASTTPIIERWNVADDIRWIKTVPMKTYPMQYGQTVQADGFTITLPPDGDVDCKVLLMACKEWDILQWEMGHG